MSSVNDIDILRKIIREELKATSDNEWSKVYGKIEDTVVQVFTTSRPYNWINPKFQQLGIQKSTGSGFFHRYKNRLLIITNYHVVHEAIKNQTTISIPSYGKQKFQTNIIGVAPDRDVAILVLTKEATKELKKLNSNPPSLELGNSDNLTTTAKIMAVGYPFGLQNTSIGIVSGFPRLGAFSFIQITAAINPGNSGGPSFDTSGQVMGINSRGISQANNIGFFIPINEVKSIIKTLVNSYYDSGSQKKIGIIRQATLDAVLKNVTPEIADYYNLPGKKARGQIITKIFVNSILRKNNIKENDILISINGGEIDPHGEIPLHHNSKQPSKKNGKSKRKRISIYELLNRKTNLTRIKLVIHRNGKSKDIYIKFTETQRPIRFIYPKFEIPEYTEFAGMMLMNLRENHIDALVRKVVSSPFRSVPSHFTYLLKYKKQENQDKFLVVVTDVMPGSRAQKSEVLYPGVILDTIDGKKIRTIDDFLRVLKQVPNKRFNKDTVLIKTKHEKNIAVIRLTDIELKSLSRQ